MSILKERHVVNNKGLIICSADIDDAQELLSYIGEVDRETDFLLREPGEFNMTLEEEREYIENIKDRERSVLLTAKLNGKIVGTLGFTGENYCRYKHRGEFGVSVLKDFWGRGIGSELIKTMIDWADEEGIVRIVLSVDATNQRAIRLYEKLGFVREGILKDDIRMVDGEYRDSIVMARVNVSNKE